MNKKEFLDMFASYDKNHISNIYEDIELCRNIEIPIYTSEFVTPDIYSRLKEMESSLGVMVFGNGIFNECERKVLCFSKDNENYFDYDIDLIKISNKSKFKKLTHRDYLGSLMSLGVKRELFGDLIVKEEECFVPAMRKVSDYILSNMTMVGHCPCSVKKVDASVEEIPTVSLDEKSIIVTSMRIDNIVPGICNLSRTKGNDLISSGAILVNYLQCNKKDMPVEVNDTITIRGYGKFKVISAIGETAKGRLKIVIGKYI